MGRISALRFRFRFSRAVRASSGNSLNCKAVCRGRELFSRVGACWLESLTDWSYTIRETAKGIPSVTGLRRLNASIIDHSIGVFHAGPIGSRTSRGKRTRREKERATLRASSPSIAPTISSLIETLGSLVLFSRSRRPPEKCVRAHKPSSRGASASPSWSTTVFPTEVKRE